MQHNRTDISNGLAHVGFDGVRAITISRIHVVEAVTYTQYTGTGTYTLDQWCRGTGTITLKYNGVVTGTSSFSFVVSGTPTSPEITAIITSGPPEFTGMAYFRKIGL